MKKILTGALLLVTVLQVTAQEESSNKIIRKSKGYSLLYGGIETSTISYINTDTKDSSGVNLYIAPYIDYNHKSGLGINIKSYTLPGGSNPGFFLTAISPYFAKYDGNILPYISYSRLIQHDNLSVPYSPIQNEIYAHLRIKTKFVDPMAGVDYGFGNDEQNNNESVSDVNAFFGLSHLFLKDNLGVNKSNALAVRPGIQLNAGTDRYFKFLRSTGYISQNTNAKRIGYGRRTGTSGNGGNGGNGGNETPVTTADVYTISEENSFKLSNIEANLSVLYFFGKFSIEPSGSLYFPLRGDDKTTYGYWQINLNYWFK